MPWLVAPMVALGVLAGTGSAAAAIYVPGQYRDGVYTHPHFLDAPLVKGVKMESEDAKMPKPLIIDEQLSPEQLSPEKLSPEKLSPEKLSPEQLSPEQLSPGKLPPEAPS